MASAMWKGSSQEVGGVLLWRYGVVFVLCVWFRGSCPLASYCHILCDQYQLWICCFESHPPSLRGSVIPKCLTPPFNPLSPFFIFSGRKQKVWTLSAFYQCMWMLKYI